MLLMGSESSWGPPTCGLNTIESKRVLTGHQKFSQIFFADSRLSQILGSESYLKDWSPAWSLFVSVNQLFVI